MCVFVCCVLFDACGLCYVEYGVFVEVGSCACCCVLRVVCCLLGVALV